MTIPLLATAAPAFATHISGKLDLKGLRTRLGPTEGLLHFRDGGEETTGWTDVRAPSLAGPRDTVLGYDRSDHFVNVRTTVLTDSMGVAATGSAANAMAARTRDFNFANQIYGQAGISVLETGTRNYTSGTNPGAPNTATNFTFNVTTADMVNIKTNLNGAAGTIDTYYAGPSTTLNGATFVPSGSAKPAVFIFDDPERDTFAHEVGHYLLDRNQFTNADTDHSPIRTDLMASGETRMTPGDAQKKDGNTAPSDPGQRVGSIGKVDHFDAPVKLNGAGADIDQLQAIASSATVQKRDNPGAGDHVDFDWVQDHIPIELRAPAGDNHPPVDFMVWEIGALAASISPGHDHGNWLAGTEPELNLGRYDSASFRLVDVVSQIARYADMDVRGANWSRRDSALDYILEFSPDGSPGSFQPGTPIDVFKDGWNPRSKAEDFVARWQSPVDAKFLRIAASPLGGDHDGNAQIDAIVAAQFERDFGDAPDSYKTLLASDGPRYQEGGLQRLGKRWDSEPDGQPTLGANGDDRNILGFGLLDDEDGVDFGSSFVDVTLRILRDGLNEYWLDAWMDCNRNDMFDHPIERFIHDLLSLVPGLHTFRYPIPCDPTHYSRFRLTWVDDPLGMLGGVSRNTDVTPFGEFFGADGISHGEVEDYVSPEPSTVLLAGLGALGMVGYGWRRRGGGGRMTPA